MAFTIHYRLHANPGPEQQIEAVDQSDAEAKVAGMVDDLAHAVVLDENGRPIAEWRAGRPGLFAVEGTESWVSKP